MRKKRFYKVNIEISNICNLQCSFCPEVLRTKKIMPLELFRSIIQQVAPLTEQVCFHLMGDPLIHPNLEEFVQICSQYKVPVFLVTNGLLMREKQSELLLNPAFRQINFSLHSFHDNFKDKDPTAYLEKIFKFTEKAMLVRPDLYINYRLWNLQETRGVGESNQQMLQKILNRFAGLDKVSFKDKNGNNPLDSIQVDVRKNKKSIRILNRLYLHFDTEFKWPEIHLPILGDKGFCYGLSSHFGILVDGTVVPCCLDKEGNIPLGNIQEQSLEDILQSERSMNIISGFKNRQLKEELCKRCQYIERF